MRQIARQGRPQQIGPTTGAMLLFARDHVARAHRPGGRLATDPRAIAHFNSPMKALVFRKVDVLAHRLNFVVAAKAQLLGHRRAVNDVAWVEQVVRIERVFHLAIEPV